MTIGNLKVMVSKSFILEHCNCSRTIFTHKNNFQVNFESTTCGRDAYMRGTNQKVAAFVFYGDNIQRKYFEGIVQNAELLHEEFDRSWMMRLYHNLGSDHPQHPQLCNITCHYPHLDLCYIRQLPGINC